MRYMARTAQLPRAVYACSDRLCAVHARLHSWSVRVKSLALAEHAVRALQQFRYRLQTLARHVRSELRHSLSVQRPPDFQTAGPSALKQRPPLVASQPTEYPTMFDDSGFGGNGFLPRHATAPHKRAGYAVDISFVRDESCACYAVNSRRRKPPPRQRPVRRLLRVPLAMSLPCLSSMPSETSLSRADPCTLSEANIRLLVRAACRLNIKLAAQPDFEADLRCEGFYTHAS